MECGEFTKKYYTKRKNTNCIKWDREDVKNKLPMFIADMDFKSDEAIIESLHKRLDHGVFGYSFIPKDYCDEVIKWNKKRNKVTYKKEWIRFSKGAVDALYQLLYSLTKEKDKILITTPVYHPFFSTIRKTKRTLVTSKLLNNNGLFTFDFKDLENKFKTKTIKAIILCSPHNPLGRVWTKDELSKLFKLTHKYRVLVFSDEVHSDLIMSGYKHTPSLSFKEYQNDIITINTASKTFSLAIFAHSHIIIPNKKYREIFDKYQEEYHLNNVNAFNALPTYYGYKYSEGWLESALKVIEQNYKYMCSRLSKYLDFLPLQGTFLVFANFEKYTKNAVKFLDEKCSIVVNPGDSFAKGYEAWARINIATSLDNIKLACNKIEKQLKKNNH